MAPRGREDLGQRLLELKEDLEEKKSKRSELQGELKSLMQQLKEFGVETFQQAESLIKKQEQELEEMEQSIRIGIGKIEDLMYPEEGVDEEQEEE
jgi:uncharacterized phage infection (PIP) family protein YhgE